MVRSRVFASNITLYFWGDPAEYATYIVTEAKLSRSWWCIPTGVLTKKLNKANEIVIFGSACAIYVDARNKSLGEPEKAAIIIGKSDEIKGYKVTTLKIM